MPNRIPIDKPLQALIPGKSQRTTDAVYDNNRPSAALRGYNARWRRLRLLVLHRSPICVAIGCDNDAKHVDHIIPKKQGGRDTLENLQALCQPCHNRKTAKERQKTNGR